MCVLVYMYVCSFAYVCLYKRLFVRVQRLIYVCIFVDLHECICFINVWEYYLL